LRVWFCAEHKSAFDALSYQYSKKGGSTKEEIDAWKETGKNKLELVKAILGHTYANRQRERNGRWSKFDICRFRESLVAKQSVARKWKAVPMDLAAFLEFKKPGVTPDDAFAQ